MSFSAGASQGTLKGKVSTLTTKTPSFASVVLFLNGNQVAEPTRTSMENTPSSPFNLVRMTLFSFVGYQSVVTGVVVSANKISS